MAAAHNAVSLVIIDDNPGSLEFLSSALARDHVKVFTASSPEEGLDLVYTHRPQIVLTDLVMPGLSGLNVLDRVIEFDPAKLLRVLQNQEVQRIGSLTPRKVDVRVIAATNKDLRQGIAKKEFREDLYYRLSMVEINVPALAERMDDLTLLTQHFVKKFVGQYGKQIQGLTRRAQIVLSRHPWPGNVRELENVIGHASARRSCAMKLRRRMNPGIYRLKTMRSIC
jgi:DNA-binding NtrC family response regulator